MSFSSLQGHLPSLIYPSLQMNTALINDPTRSRQIMERSPASRWGRPDDFEGLVVYLASRASDYVCGECITVDGGWMARESLPVQHLDSLRDHNIDAPQSTLTPSMAG